LKNGRKKAAAKYAEQMLQYQPGDPAAMNILQSINGMQ